MERTQGILSLAGVGFRSVGLLGKLALVAGGLKRARRQALRGFRQGLAEMGVPAGAAEALAEAYPHLDVEDFVRGRRNKADETAPSR